MAQHIDPETGVVYFDTLQEQFIAWVPPHDDQDFARAYGQIRFEMDHPGMFLREYDPSYGLRNDVVKDMARTLDTDAQELFEREKREGRWPKA